MKKTILTLILTLTFSNLGLSTFAESTKFIKLKDGSLLNGKVLELKNSIYTVETSNLGTIEIPESDIVSISSVNEELNQNSINTTEADKEKLSNMTEQLQGAVFADQGLMTEIQNLANDEEIKALLSDPTLLDAAMNFDANKLQNNKNAQDLMNNPKIKNLINKIQQKMPAQP